MLQILLLMVIDLQVFEWLVIMFHIMHVPQKTETAGMPKGL